MAVAALTAVTACAPADDDGGLNASGLAATLQADANALFPQAAPGVLVDVRTSARTVKVRARYINVADKTPVPWNARFRVGSLTKTYVAATVLQPDVRGLVRDRKVPNPQMRVRDFLGLRVVDAVDAGGKSEAYRALKAGELSGRAVVSPHGAA